MTETVDKAMDSREFPFTAEQFRLISERIYRFAGIRLPEGKREMVYARLARRLRTLGLASFDDYVRLPFGHPPAVLEEGIQRLARAWRAYAPGGEMRGQNVAVIV